MTKDEALKMALECAERCESIDGIDWSDTIDAIKEALAQPKQELVGDEWTPCLKLPFVVHVRQQRRGETHVSTREGITPAKPDDLIMRGVEGEEYPIGSVLFLKTYTFDTSPPNEVNVELLEALKGLWQHEWTTPTEYRAAGKAARDAIAKATGETE